MTDVRYACSGALLLTCGADRAAWALRAGRGGAAAGKRAGCVALLGHDAAVVSVDVTHGLHRDPRAEEAHAVAATADERGVVRLWNAASGRAAAVHDAAAAGAAARFFHMDRLLLVAAGREVRLCRWSLAPADAAGKGAADVERLKATGRVKPVARLAHPGVSVAAVACLNAAPSHLVLAAGSNREVLAWDALAGRELRRFSDGHERACHTVCLPQPSPFAAVAQQALEVLATAAPDDSVLVWDMRSARPALRLHGHSNRAGRVGVAFSPCLLTLACGSEDGACCFYDLRTGSLRDRVLLAPGCAVSALAWCPREPRLAAGTTGGSMHWLTGE